MYVLPSHAYVIKIIQPSINWLFWRHQPVFLCEIMQPCCIPLRDLRYLRENTRKSTQSICTDETQMYPADLAHLRRRTPKQHEPHNLSFSAK